MRRHVPFLALTVALVLNPGLAAAEPANLDPMTPGRPGPVARLYLAQELFFQGLATSDALALIQSARMMAQVGLIETPDRLPETSGPVPSAADTRPMPFPDAVATLATAQALAKGDDLLLSVIETTRRQPPVPRGAVRRSVSALAPGGTDLWTVAFFGAVPAELAVLGNGRSTLSVTVTDEAGQGICTTHAASDRLYCRFTPAQNGVFLITVFNPGNAVDAYVLITN